MKIRDNLQGVIPQNNHGKRWMMMCEKCKEELKNILADVRTIMSRTYIGAKANGVDG